VSRLVRSAAALLIVLLASCSTDAASPPPTVAQGQASAEPPEGQPAPEGIDGVVAVTGLTNEHTDEHVQYPTYPPLGGDHYPDWWTCGFYDTVLSDEPAVHSLEHGAVWIAYRPDVTEATITQLQAMAEADTHILVSPYPGLRAPLVVTAWGRQLDVERIDDPRVQEFLAAYLRAGDAPEPGVTCGGGLTQ
jgi:hypothetical protein